MKAKILKNILKFMLAFVVLVGMLPAVSSSLFAADQTPHGSEGVVKYFHPGDHPESTAKYVQHGTVNNYPDKAASDIYGDEEGQRQYVYCVNPNQSAVDSERFNANFRWRWNLTVNKWLLDNNKRGLANPDLAPGSDGYNDLVKVLYAGYPHNGTGTEFNYKATQDAVFYVVTGTGSPNEVVEAANSVNLDDISATAYIYFPDSDAKQTIQNTVGLKVWSTTPPTPPGPADQTVDISFAAQKTINGGSEGFDRDNNQFAFRLEILDDAGDVEDGQWHTRILPRDTSDEAPGDIFFGTLTYDSAGKHKFRIREISPNEGLKDPEGRPMVPETPGMTYDNKKYEFEINVVEDGGELKVLYNGTDVSGKVIGVGDFKFDNKKVDIPEPTVRTMVNPNEIDAAKDQTFTDTVTLTNLTEGVEYTITGALMDKEAQDEVTSAECEPLTFTATADDAAASEVTKEMNFKVDATDYAGKELVVFETLTWTVDGEEKSVGHTQYDDADQTLTVKENEPEPGPEPEPEPDDRKPSIGTVVTANGVDATETKEARLTWDETRDPVSVVDTIKYNGLVKDVTYHVKGVLVDVAQNGDFAEITEAEDDFIAEDTSGTWELDFGEVPLEDYHKYVVFERVYAETGDEKATKDEPLKHEDTKDKAQTILTEDKHGYVLGDEEEPYQGKLSTTVSVEIDKKTKKATSNSAVKLSATDAAKVKTVTDEIKYEGLQDGDTYAVKGTLVEVKDNKIVKTVATNEQEFMAEGAKGTWKMEFKNVKLEAGKTYVVLEEANNVDVAMDTAEHKDLKDKAQTIVVEAASSKAPKTGDETNITIWIVIIVVAAAAIVAGIVINKKRKKSAD